jgi:hypothetical protein
MHVDTVDPNRVERGVENELRASSQGNFQLSSKRDEKKTSRAHAAGLREIASNPSPEKNSTRDEASYCMVRSQHTRTFHTRPQNYLFTNW